MYVALVRFGLAMEVSLKTSTRDRGLWLQPMTGTGPEINPDESAPSFGGATAGPGLLMFEERAPAAWGRRPDST